MKIFLLLLCLFCLPMEASARTPATGDVTLCVDNGGNDANSGIAPSCKKTICAAARTFYEDHDLRNFAAFVKVTGGQDFNESCFLGGQLTGINLLQIVSSSPTVPFKWLNASTCLAFGDNAEIRVFNATFVCNTSNTPSAGAVYVHNNGVFDLDGKTIFSGGGPNDTAIICDGPCVFTVADGVEIQGQFKSVVWGGRLMAGTFSGPVTFNGSVVGGFFTLRSNSTINLGASFNNSGLAYIGPSLVSGNSVFNANGILVPGGIITSTGGLVCNGYC